MRSATKLQTGELELLGFARSPARVGYPSDYWIFAA
jgi:hypothetical protein